MLFFGDEVRKHPLFADMRYLEEISQEQGLLIPGSKQRAVYCDPERLGEIVQHISESLLDTIYVCYRPMKNDDSGDNVPARLRLAAGEVASFRDELTQQLERRKKDAALGALIIPLMRDR